MERNRPTEPTTSEPESPRLISIIEEALSWYAPRPEELKAETEHLNRICRELRISL